MMRIIADENMPLVHAFFAPHADIELVAGRQMTAAQLQGAQALLVRSVTPVTATLLRDADALQFVGTATIGTDHVDKVFLAEQGIEFHSAPGCNAQSVMEYVLSCLWVLVEQKQCRLQDLTIGVVGVGNIGQRLVNALRALGVHVLCCDPWRANEAGFTHIEFSQLCQQVDVLSFHVPKVVDGPHPTLHLLDAAQLAALAPQVAIINAARGDVIDNQALLAEQQSGVARALFLDVWEQEPDILTALVPYCRIATAHIAGHSVEGKARGTEMLYQAWCRQQGQQPQRQLIDLLPAPLWQQLQISPNFGLLDVQNLCRLLYDVRRDDAMFRYHLAGHGFDWLRKNYPPRREFGALTLVGTQIPAYLSQLGFSQSTF
jgi:erythronate-4-phosphate dehydrogenase